MVNDRRMDAWRVLSRVAKSADGEPENGISSRDLSRIGTFTSLLLQASTPVSATWATALSRLLHCKA